MKYRPEINGLRSIAVVPVILFHAGFTIFSGGYIGVDVFFVISGFLITNIIISELEQGQFSVIGFYERRARRILPALFLVMLSCIPFAWLWMLPSQLKGFGQSLVAVSVFASNVLFWLQSGYFEAASELKPLLHTWSLAVEEQYYLLFPLLLIIIWRIGRRRVLYIVIALTIISLLLSEWAAQNKPPANFYLSPTRAWELLAGSICAFLQFGKDQKRNNILSVLGLTLIVFSIFAFDHNTPFPSVFALAPVVGTSLIIMYGSSGTLVATLLSTKPLVGIGLISYSAYLWHQPLFAFARIRSLNEPSPNLMAGLVIMAMVLAWISWRFVEKPFRDRTRTTNFQIFFGGVSVSIALISVGTVLHLNNGMPMRFDAEILRLLSFESDKGHDPMQVCNPSDQLPTGGCIFNISKQSRAALWGDSHALALATGLADVLGERGFGLESFTRSGCAPVPGLVRIGNPECESHNKLVQKYLLGIESPKLILLSARWALNLDGNRFDNGEGGVESGQTVVLQPTTGNVTEVERLKIIRESYRANVVALLDAGKTVILIGNIPEVGWHAPQRLAKKRILNVDRLEPLSTSFEVFKARNTSSADVWNLLPKDPRLVIVEPHTLFCDTVLPTRCAAQWNGDPIYSDDDHVNSIGSGLIVNLVAKQLERLLIF